MMRSALVFLALALSPSLASAFCRTTTCDTSATGADRCRYDAAGCETTGIPLAWERGCVSFSVQEDASALREIDYDTTQKLVTRAFDTWLAADCDGGAPSIEVTDLGPSECRTPEYNSSAGNANVIMFQDDAWPYTGATTLALTTITFNIDTGEIFDADIEINSARTPLTTSNTNIDFDLLSILTHETGHFLGLEHSEFADATMKPQYDSGEILRDLTADDVAGICEIYPPNRSVRSTSCTPRHGLTHICSPPPPDKSRCSISPGGVGHTPIPAPWLFAAVALGAAGLVRRRTQR